MPHVGPTVLGIDVGGTFTDAVLIANGGLQSTKVPSTSPQSLAVMRAAETVLTQSGLPADRVDRFVHGMTVATNSLLERKGARVVCVLTEGFRDLLQIERQQRDVLYTLYPHRHPSLVPRERCLGARERVGPEGVRVALTLEEAERVADEVAALDPEAVAVCLLWSFRRPDHERLLGDALARALPDVPVVLSSELVPLFREFERASTTVVDAYVTPRTRAYLTELGEACMEADLAEPEIMQSSGGTARLSRALAHAGHLLLSGPAGGVLAARVLGDRLGVSPLLTFDMGGTSTDCAALMGEGSLPVSTDRTVAGHVVRLPMADINTVSAGGGSIAWLDPGGALKVGPESAGAEPGPACYGRGGIEATVTDANVVLGRIPSRMTLGGLRLRPELALEAVGRLAAEAGLGIEETAEGILRVAVFNMAAALRKVTVERGIDPRGFTLLAFGGAGALHACSLADDLGISRVVVPLRAGVLSALGLASAPAQHDSSATVMWRLDPSPGADAAARTTAPPAADARPRAARDAASLSDWHDVWDRLEGNVRAVLTSEHTMDAHPPRITREAEVRYVGQSYELSLGLPADARPVDLPPLFHQLHEQRYGYRNENTPVEVVSVRVTGRVTPTQESPPEPLPTLHRAEESSIWLDGRRAPCPVLVTSGTDADSPLPVDRSLVGPALIGDPEFSLFLEPGWRVEPLPGALLMAKEEA
jgi:N-methylhydantoinase A